MPILNFPTSPDGFALDVIVGLAQQEADALQQAGQPVPPLAGFRGIIDSGSDVSAVSRRIIQQFNITPRGRVPTLTAGGSRRVRYCNVMLVIAGPAGILGGSYLLLPTLVVTEIPHRLPNIEVLVGRDVLKQCLFIADGPAQTFTLAF